MFRAKCVRPGAQATGPCSCSIRGVSTELDMTKEQPGQLQTPNHRWPKSKSTIGKAL